MPTVNIPVALVAISPGTFQDWFANGPNTDKGDFSAVGGGIIALATNKSQSYVLSDLGTLPGGANITNVSISSNIVHSPPGSASVKLYFYLGGGSPFQQFESSGFTGTGGHAYASAVNPKTSATWTRADVFNFEYGIKCTALGVSVPAALTSAGGLAGFSVNVDYTTTPPPPTTITIDGSGGITAGGEGTTNRQVSSDARGGAQISGNPGILQAGAGVPPELHINQWGLFQFVMKSRLEERL